LRDVIAAHHKCAAKIARTFAGFVSQYPEDGVLVYFGCPEAHEDDGERAVRAGLELVAAVAGLKKHATLQTAAGRPRLDPP
jgi:class 3 adenylate cyclase